MNELDLLLAEMIATTRHRRQQMRATAKTGRRDKINLARPIPRAAYVKAYGASA